MLVKLFSPPMHPSMERDVMKLAPAFGVYVLAGVLREHGYDVEVYDHQILLGAYEEEWDTECIQEIIEDEDLIDFVKALGIMMTQQNITKIEQFRNKQKSKIPFKDLFDLYYQLQRKQQLSIMNLLK